MPNYRNILNNQARVSIPTSDGELHIDYYPSRLTQRLITQFIEFESIDTEALDKQTLEKAFHEINMLIVGLIKEWNLEDGDVLFPLDADRMMELPVDLIQEITGAMIRGTRPNGIAPQSRKK